MKSADENTKPKTHLSQVMQMNGELLSPEFAERLREAAHLNRENWVPDEPKNRKSLFSHLRRAPK